MIYRSTSSRLTYLFTSSEREGGQSFYHAVLLNVCLKIYLCVRKTGLDLRLDILDTGGSYVFPAMRTLAIKSADGFILVCAVDDPASLEVFLFPFDQFYFHGFLYQPVRVFSFYYHGFFFSSFLYLFTIHVFKKHQVYYGLIWAFVMVRFPFQDID